jgi:hypothetical protein
MSISTANSSISYVGNASTSTPYVVPFYFIDSTDLTVYVTNASGTTTTLPFSAYTVIGAGVPSGGSLTTATAIPATSTVVIARNVPATQLTSFTTGDRLPAASLERALDKLTMQSQQLGRAIDTRSDDAAVSIKSYIDDEVNNLSLYGASNPMTRWGYTGNGSTLAFAVTGSNVSQSSSYLVTLDGVTQDPASYTVFNETLTFSEAPAVGCGIVIVCLGYQRALTNTDDYPVTATGSITARTLSDRFGDLANVKDFGAVGDGVTDDTAAIQAAIIASYGQTLYFPSATYKISSTITIAEQIYLLGDSRFSSIIRWNNATLEAFNVTTDTAISIEHLQFAVTVTPTAGYTFQFAGNTSNNSFSTFRNVTFSHSYIAIKSLKAMTLSISTCYFYGHQNAGVLIQNNYNSDAGDSTIVDCVFSEAGPSASGILQYSSGGLKVLGTKILGGLYGIRLFLASTATTSILLVNGNSIEGYIMAAVSADLQAVGGTFTNVLINGNQFSSSEYNGASGIVLNSVIGFLNNVNIAGNIITLPNGNSYGIVLGNIIGGCVTGNYIVGMPNQPSTGITFTQSSSNTMFAGNCFVNCLYNVTNLNGAFNGQNFILGQTSQNVAVPSQTTEYAFATLNIPAYTLGANGLIRIKGRVLCTNNANAKTLRVRFGGVSGAVVFSAAMANSSYVSFSCEIGNTNTNAQSTVGDYTKDATMVAALAVTSALNTTSAQSVVISGQKATAGDTLILLNYCVEIVQS